jgi:microcystin-dependent protein
MAEIGDKSFTTDMIQLIKDAVKAELGTNAFVNRYLAEVTAVNSTTSEITVKLSGSDAATDGFRSRGLQLPAVGDQVVACVDGQDRWIESVVRPATSTPYLQISSGVITGISGAPTGSVVGWLTGTAPTGWLLCNGASYAYNTYPALGALLGGSAGGNFTVPDMRDRYLGGLATVGTWSNTAWAVQTGPNSQYPNDRGHTHLVDAHTHNFTGDGHTHDAGTYNPTATTIGAITSSSDAHTHTVDPTAFTSPSASAASSVPSGTGGGTMATSAHTHTINVPSTTSSSDSHSHTTTVASHDHGFNGSSGSTTETGTTDNNTVGVETEIPKGGITWTPYPKSTLVNFIIKT